MGVNLNTVAEGIRLQFSDASIEVEDYAASWWLNITLGERTFTVEARGARKDVGFSEINDAADFGGHNAVVPCTNATDLSTRRARLVQRRCRHVPLSPPEALPEA